MHYVIHAYDGPDALDRRLANRTAHLDGARALKAGGHFILGGALLDADGKMIGSMMVLAFDTNDQFQTWYDNEPYILNNVWDRIDINPFRRADI